MGVGKVLVIRSSTSWTESGVGLAVSIASSRRIKPST